MKSHVQNPSMAVSLWCQEESLYSGKLLCQTRFVVCLPNLKNLEQGRTLVRLDTVCEVQAKALRGPKLILALHDLWSFKLPTYVKIASGVVREVC